MLISNHVLSGLAIGLLAKKKPLAAFGLGVISHFVLDSHPHWGVDPDREDKDEYFLKVAKRDGVVGLSIAGLGLLLAPEKLSTAAAVAGAVAPDLDHPLKYFTGRTLWPNGFNSFHSRIQRGRESEARLAQEFLTAATLGAIGLGVLVAARKKR